MKNRTRFTGLRSGVRAFTLLEVLVASAVFLLLLVIVINVATQTASVTSLSTRRSSADASGRQAFDRMAADFSRIVLRRDVPDRIDKREGNDTLTFHSRVAGYEGDRGVSQIGFGISGGQLLRGNRGTFWDSASGTVLPFSSTSAPTFEDLQAEPIGADIFRFELSFLLADGTASNSVTSLRSTAPQREVKAVIATIAVLDARSRQTITETTDQLAAYFPDAVDGADTSATWNSLLKVPFGTGLIPDRARSSIRVYQRYFYIDD